MREKTKSNEYFQVECNFADERLFKKNSCHHTYFEKMTIFIQFESLNSVNIGTAKQKRVR